MTKQALMNLIDRTFPKWEGLPDDDLNIREAYECENLQELAY